MGDVEYWTGCLLLAAVRRHRRHGMWDTDLQSFYERTGGYRSLRFRVHSHAFNAARGAK